MGNVPRFTTAYGTAYGPHMEIHKTFSIYIAARATTSGHVCALLCMCACMRVCSCGRPHALVEVSAQVGVLLYAPVFVFMRACSSMCLCVCV